MWLLLLAAPVSAQDVRFVLEIGDRGYVVLSQDPDARWVRGDEEVVHSDELRIATAQPVDRRLLPAETIEALDDRYASYDSLGLACEGELGEPALVRLVDVQWLDPDERDDELAMAQENDAYTDVLAAPFDAHCARAGLWAHAVSSAPSAMFVPGTGDGGADVDALAAFRALPRYAELQSEYDAWRGEGASDEEVLPPRWENYDGNAPTFERLVDPSTHRTIVLVHAEAGYGCGGFVGSLWAAFERGPDGALVERASGWTRPIALIGDGAMRAITYEAIGEAEIQREPWMCPC